jgi:hypothetical protein
MPFADDKPGGVVETLVRAPIRPTARGGREGGVCGDQGVVDLPRQEDTRPESAKRDQSLNDVTEEVDVWWGGYASRTMLPSFLICILATVAIAWLAWMSLPSRLVKISFIGLAGGVWLLQLVRWGYRYFGFTYRLTTRRLFCHLGELYGTDKELELAGVAQVVVRSRWDERLVGVGQVVVIPEKPTTPPIILEGILAPTRLAELIRTRVQRAREQTVVQARV